MQNQFEEFKLNQQHDQQIFGEEELVQESELQNTKKIVKKVKLEQPIAEPKQPTFQEKETIVSEIASYQEKITLEQPQDGFYRTKEGFDKTVREQLPTTNLRKFHNWIKSALIIKFTQQIKLHLPIKQKKKGLYVLDIGCGKGGDLNKWANAQTALYVGVDITPEGLIEASSRHLQLKKKFKAVFIERNGGHESTIAAPFLAPLPNLLFDIVSCQFTLHYLFDNEKSAHNVLKNVSQSLAKDGFFICTIPDANVIVKRLRNIGQENALGEYVCGNEFYSMKFEKKKFSRKQLYGIKYGFHLQDAIGQQQALSDLTQQTIYVPEYLIEFQNLVLLAKSYDLELVLDKNFLDFYVDNRGEYQKLFQILKLQFNEKEAMKKELWEISQLYKVVAFKKTTGQTSFKDLDRNFHFHLEDHEPYLQNKPDMMDMVDESNQF